MKIAVYDRWWSTVGGGEKFAGGVAQVLSQDHDVTLMAHEPVDRDWLGERLGLDLRRTKVELIGEASRLERASAAHDLLINLSYRSSDRNGAPHGLYVVHFPHDPFEMLPPRQADLLRKVGPYLAARHPRYEVREGFYPADLLRASKVWWTDGEGEIVVPVAPGERTTVRLFVPQLIAGDATVPAQIFCDDELVTSIEVGPPRSRKDVLLPRIVTIPVTGRADGRPVRIVVRSEIWIPDDVLHNNDVRTMGIPISGIMVGTSLLGLGRAYASLFEAYPPSIGYLDSYDRILANSAFTQRWITEYWGRDSDLLYPPVGLRTPADLSDPGAGKEPIILSVGRFFAADRGHSKKQIEMVRAFRALLARRDVQALPGIDTWQLHLVGGCSPDDRPYLDEVRAEAEGLPVTFHVDAPGSVLDDLYRRASIYWHAAGMGEDVRANPVRMEHFGITTVEAMSAGAVPVAYGEAGPLEAFTHGVEGFHFHTEDELVGATVKLWKHPALVRTMRAAAIAKAETFGMEAFSGRVHAYVDEVAAQPVRPH